MLRSNHSGPIQTFGNGFLIEIVTTQIELFGQEVRTKAF